MNKIDPTYLFEYIKNVFQKSKTTKTNLKIPKPKEVVI